MDADTKTNRLTALTLANSFAQNSDFEIDAEGTVSRAKIYLAFLNGDQELKTGIVAIVPGC